MLHTPPRSNRALTPALHPNIPQMRGMGSSSKLNNNTGDKFEEASDSDASSSSAASPRMARNGRCFCGREVSREDGGIYCSVACARSDAFSSLCYKSNDINEPSSSSVSNPPASLSLSRSQSSASTTSNSSEDWNASHYRRLARAESRRDERREERKRRRAEATSTSSRSTTISISSSASRNVPDLVGGHSRNHSVASSISSHAPSTLSRNPSSASTTSSRRYGGVHVDSVIMEDEDEEFLSNGSASSAYENKPYTPYRKGHRRKGSGLSVSQRRHQENFGMGKDMRDVLEEIIQMEKGFQVDREDRTLYVAPDESASRLLFPAPALEMDGPPRTPSPMIVDARRTSQVPGAPRVHRRSTVSHVNPQEALLFAPLSNGRPPSFVGGHQSSLSESHTALYLATASPGPKGFVPLVESSGDVIDRRSASPNLQTRRSLTFTPEADGPSISTLQNIPMPSFRDSMNGLTPSKRRGNISPSAVHPAMDAWRFPSSGGQKSRVGSGGSVVTPTRPPPIQTTNLQSNMTSTPSRPSASGQPRPQLLWPASSLPPPPLAPALFPSSPANPTPDYPPLHSHLPPGTVSGSGMRLGVLLGSGEEGGDEDVDMDEGDDDSTAQGHGERGYLPVFLEAEGFRSTSHFRW